MEASLKVKINKVIKGLHQLSNQMDRVALIMNDVQDADHMIKHFAAQLEKDAALTKRKANYLSERL